MLELEVEINPELTGDLASRIMSRWPGLEVETHDNSVTFAIPVNNRLDEGLQAVEAALQKIEQVRGLEELNVRARNVFGPDTGPEAINLGRFVIRHPETVAISNPDRITLVVDAGQAFGTGGHASTALALTAIEQYFSPPPGAPSTQGNRVLDVGTGSGVLALAAARMGAGPVLAVDPSAEAIEAARLNVERNQLTDQIALEQCAADQISGEFDLIVANLVTSVLTRTQRKLAKLMAPQGAMIVAGFADAQTPQIVKALTKTGLVTSKSYSRDGWTGLILVRAE